ncbi:putative bifunctional diguanylate cyclase/phosphodiesterase [Alkalilimnicola sp. S0819]|uniref:putative bifunctional diguanylate cyclase/phosphodiesterase n=1 Tax=Alkalilimnicola sp. S0819 TaxID=2613922 RepID=UPI001261F730|nr:EAL domain-containing response regulator [Alkalilimnicola sp. S0819]KAB7627678.1 EAL domain-containing protein [Alkalilimnicola sp. S0819]MPQ15845.1 EAL domain-containing protein [Alkalilimnicola sp. S0819]
MTNKNEYEPLVLAVDDDPLMLALVQRVLAGVAEVIGVDNGVEALQRAVETPPPDLILLDVRMPGMDGHAVCRRLKADPRTSDIPVIFTTGLGEDEDEAAGFEMGAADYITKPFRPAVVRARVRAHLQARMLTRQVRQDNALLDRKVRERTRELEAEIQVRRETEQRLQHQVYHDDLTGLPNQVLLRRYLTELCRRDEACGLLLFAFNGFVEINNTLGHQNGSQALALFAQRLQSLVRQFPGARRIEGQARLVRMEGVCFAVLVDPEHGTEVLLRAARELQAEIEQPLGYQGMSLSISAQVGIAWAPEHGKDAETLLRHAHIALQQSAQEEGQLAVYREDGDQYSARRLSLLGDLREAIQEGGLTLAYQPQLDLAAGQVCGAEALLRWEHPHFGFIPPDEFIPMAEQTGVIRPLTDWVLAEAARQCAAFRARGYTLAISVNLSARNLREPDLLERIIAHLAAHDLPRDALLLELTETEMMRNQDGALAALLALEAAGLQLSIDDFGTGFSSLAYLKRLPVRELKIDRSFVSDMLCEQGDRVIVRTIIQMAHNLGLKVVAEGVEDQPVLDALAEMGCDRAQGYHLCRPVAPEAMLEWMGREELSSVRV